MFDKSYLLSDKCPAEWTMIASMLSDGSGTCLSPGNIKQGFEQAKSECSSKGAIIAEPKNANENNELYKWAMSNSGFDTNQWYWLGLTPGK